VVPDLEELTTVIVDRYDVESMAPICCTVHGISP
jgi:hypothetical protein